ncbi:hypothetical protein RCL_jg9665.t1 [Rhizophagus clarus]|uniref:Uncharacterized protein n=1 Tax=Rhizophagus clarus TaxID=94130 RepID=A0A8H3LUW2_9GLOM|nr:hypothetical protein RCL_jg9665.t1 [Rhizophagus clarus]
MKSFSHELGESLAWSAGFKERTYLNVWTQILAFGFGIKDTRYLLFSYLDTLDLKNRDKRSKIKGSKITQAEFIILLY